MSLDSEVGTTMLASVGAKPRSVLPPLPSRDWKPVRFSDLTSARVLAYGDHPITRRRPRGSTPAQKSGLRYQRRVCEQLRLLARGGEILVGPWVEYNVGLRRGYCQPDGIVHHRDLTFVFEIKLSTTTDAWWQLRHLYGPVCEFLFPKQRIVLVNVVKSHYPETRFPEDTWTFEIGLEGLFEKSSRERIIQWRPGG